MTVTWFEALTGFAEDSPSQVRANLVLDGTVLRSRVNGATMDCGRLETPSLTDLRKRVRSTAHKQKAISVREVIADVQHLHSDRENSGALFQVASQFNLLEMVSPHITPERGIGIYENDRTQGPACAIAAGAGTIYRNYYVMVNGHIGQSATNQIDCLANIGIAFQNTDGRLWKMKNGYALATERGLTEISDRLRTASEDERDYLRGLLRVGIQSETQVTLGGAHHKVSQVYCSALPVTYSRHAPSLWEDFARLILEASYEATLCAAILNCAQTKNNTVYLTLLGGGAFGNEAEWIIDAISRAADLYRDNKLDVAIVSYGTSKPCVQRLIGDR